MPKKRAQHLFLYITFFFLHSFSLPPKHFLIIVSGKQTTKNGQKSSLKEKKKFSFFLNLFHIFPLQLRRKTKPFTFSALLSPEIEKPQRKTSRTKFFFLLFFLTFLHPTATRNRKNCHLPFFSKFRLKVPWNAAKRAQVSYFTNYLFPSVITRTHTPSQTHSVFPNHNAEKTRLTPFSKNYFFLLSTPSRYPQNTS